jgi:two-component system, cell cycle response regulator CpdR
MEMSLRPPTILLAEDEDVMRTYMARALVALGYRVHTADHGAAALAMYEFLQGQVDLLVTDIVMPYIDGVELAKRLGVRYRETFSCLFCTGFSVGAVKAETEFEGSCVLTKPFHLRTFVEAVESRIGESAPIHRKRLKVSGNVEDHFDLMKVFYANIFSFDPRELFGDKERFFDELERLGCLSASVKDISRAIIIDQGKMRNPRLGNEIQAWLSAASSDIRARSSVEEWTWATGSLFQLTMGFLGYFRWQ